MLHVRDRDDRGPARVAVVASRRVGGAVERNRAKRVLRAAAASVVLPPGVDVAIVARAATPAASSTTARAELREAVERLFDQPTGDGFPGRTTDRDAVEVTS